MKFSQISIFFLAILSAVAQTKTGLSPDVLYSRAKVSVVTILTFDSKKEAIGQGSGFIASKNHIVTNYHVIAGSVSASVLFSDGTVVTVKSVIAANPAKDIAILEVDTGNRGPLSIGNELALKVGDTVYAIGAPAGLPASLSNGLVSAFREDAGEFLIQTTAPIAPGSSGGPLLNKW